MLISVMNNQGVDYLSLPEKISGQYWISTSKNKKIENLAGIDGTDGKWILKNNRHVKIIGPDGSSLKSIEVQPNGIYEIEKDHTEKFFLLTEPVTKDRAQFTKYYVGANASISIGRGSENMLSFTSPFVSNNHALLTFSNGQWHITDNNSSNGTYVNNRRVFDENLKFGDCIYILGLKIIVSNSFFAINNPDGKLTVSSRIMKLAGQKYQMKEDEFEYELEPTRYFYCSPRFKRDIETAKIKVDSPPSSPIQDELPWPLVIGTSLSMGAMSAVTLVNAALSFNISSLVMGGSMLLGTVFFPTFTKRYEKKRKIKKEKLRQEKYSAYLEEVSGKIRDEINKQASILNENIVTIGECENRILNVQRNLWERGMGQNDFLTVRVGHGDKLLDAEISYQERRFTLNDDNLEDKLLELCEKPKYLHDVPISYSIYENKVSGIIGSREKIAEFAKGIIIQLAALYSYDEVKFVFLYDKSDAEQFDFVKWLPHIWNEDKSFRFVATNLNEVKEVSAYFEKIIENRQAINQNEMEDVTPYYVFFSMSKELGERAEMLKKILAEKENLHMSVVTVYDELKNLPKECSMVVEVNNLKGKLFDKNDISGNLIEFVPDIDLRRDPLELSTGLANINLDTSGGGYSLPGMITFLELFGVGKVEHLNPLTRWKENDPTKSLQTSVGVNTLGEPFMIDLHEKFHGPHGLVAGMTGSGKSEFIITYILSLAVNYHPDEVAFILIDYKGGGMAKALENLPHVAGVITNLDGSAIKRSLVSIESELKRRQAIFAKVSKEIGVSNIDIYKYQKLRREGKVNEPLQHLFIISDEFAELKTQQPEFMAQLVSAARIGRSLGVHLILATQKPSGVVDDQIWSNSKFKVCLKVQDRSDSMDMLKRPDAAELVQTGRFYLQVGYNELFELGQSAWAGATYFPSDKVVAEKDNSVSVIDNNGHIVQSAKFDKNRIAFASETKQLDAITAYIKNVAIEEQISVKPLWLEPIPALIYIDELKKKYHEGSVAFELNPVIGEYDDPAHQRQCIMRLPLSREGNAIIYGAAGTGKTTFLNSMIYSLMEEHTPEEVNIFILDFASETLRSFAKAPHVGDVVLSYETEKVSNLFKMLLAESEKRKKLFADYGGDYRSYIRESGKTLPNIVVVIHNYTAFAELFEEKEDAVSMLSREGSKYGIYFVLSSLSTSGVRFRLLQNFKQLMVLQLNDENEYSSVVGKTDGMVPSKMKGRGLFRTDELYEFQLANIFREGNSFSAIQKYCAEKEKDWNGGTADRIPILPEYVDGDFLSEYYNTNAPLSIPVGVEKGSLKVNSYHFEASYINMILSMGEECYEFTSDLIELIGRKNAVKTSVFDVPMAVKTFSDANVFRTAKECEDELVRLFDMTVQRNNSYKDAVAQNLEVPVFEPYLIVINSFAALKGIVSQEANKRLELILSKGCKEYNIFVIISEKSQLTKEFAYTAWYKEKITGIDGIWIGNGVLEQYTLKASKATNEMREEISSVFGYVFKRGKATKIKVLKNSREDDDYDEQ
ncbi:MAG: type VII secretion protein EssC [Lachnospiraceae bacterium]|nr:type VII secretion protein EssC [Lachnospiraceae bacterium]